MGLFGGSSRSSSSTTTDTVNADSGGGQVLTAQGTNSRITVTDQGAIAASIGLARDVLSQGFTAQRELLGSGGYADRVLSSFAGFVREQTAPDAERIESLTRLVVGGVFVLATVGAIAWALKKGKG